MIIYKASEARPMSMKNRDDAETERQKREDAARNAAFDQVNVAIQNAIRDGRTEMIFSNRLRQDVKDALLKAGYQIEDIIMGEDGWPGTKISF